jgi:hypothetical protein
MGEATVNLFGYGARPGLEQDFPVVWRYISIKEYVPEITPSGGI